MIPSNVTMRNFSQADIDKYPFLENHTIDDYWLDKGFTYENLAPIYTVTVNCKFIELNLKQWKIPFSFRSDNDLRHSLVHFDMVDSAKTELAKAPWRRTGELLGKIFSGKARFLNNLINIYFYTATLTKALSGLQAWTRTINEFHLIDLDQQRPRLRHYPSGYRHLVTHFDFERLGGTTISVLWIVLPHG